jgi:hypothetical protein
VFSWKIKLLVVRLKGLRQDEMIGGNCECSRPICKYCSVNFLNPELSKTRKLEFCSFCKGLKLNEKRQLLVSADYVVFIARKYTPRNAETLHGTPVRFCVRPTKAALCLLSCRSKVTFCAYIWLNILAFAAVFNNHSYYKHYVSGHYPSPDFCLNTALYIFQNITFRRLDSVSVFR